MNIKLNAVAVVVLSSLSAGMSNAYAGFGETPYVSYLSGEDFDVAYPQEQQLSVPKSSELPAVVRVADISDNTVVVKKNADPKVYGDMAAQAVKIEQNAIAKPIAEAPAPTETAQVNSPATSVCPAEETGYIAPCL